MAGIAASASSLDEGEVPAFGRECCIRHRQGDDIRRCGDSPQRLGKVNDGLREGTEP